MSSIPECIQKLRPLSRTTSESLCNYIDKSIPILTQNQHPLKCCIYSLNDVIYYSCDTCFCAKGDPKVFCSNCYCAKENTHHKAKKEFGKMVCCERCLNLTSKPEYDAIINNPLKEFLKLANNYFLELTEEEQFYLARAILKYLVNCVKKDIYLLPQIINVCISPFIKQQSLMQIYFHLLAQNGHISSSDITILLLFCGNSKDCGYQIFLSWFSNYNIIIKNWTDSVINSTLRESLIGSIDTIEQMLNIHPEFIESIFTCFLGIVKILKANPTQSFSNEITFLFDDLNLLIKAPQNSMKILKSTRFIDVALTTTNSFAYTNILTPYSNNKDNSVYLPIFFLSMKCKRAISYFFIDIAEESCLKKVAQKYHDSIKKDYNEMLKVARYYGLRNYVDPTYSLAFEYMVFPTYLLSIDQSTESFIEDCKKSIAFINSDVKDFNMEEYLGMFLINFLQYISFVSECCAGKWKYNNIDELAECMGQSNGTVDKYLLFIQFICAICNSNDVMEITVKFLLGIESLSISTLLEKLKEDNYHVILECTLNYLAYLTSSNFKYMETRLTTYYLYRRKELTHPKDKTDILEYYLKNFAFNTSQRGDISNLDIYNICNEIPKEVRIEKEINSCIKEFFNYKNGKITITPKMLDYINIFDVPITKNISKCDSTKRQLLKMCPPNNCDFLSSKMLPNYKHLHNAIYSKIRALPSLTQLLIDIATTDNTKVTEYTKICCLKILDNITDSNHPLVISSEKSDGLYFLLKLIQNSDIVYKTSMKKMKSNLIKQKPTSVIKANTLHNIKNSKKAFINKNKEDIYKQYQTLNQNFIFHNNIKIEGMQDKLDIGILCSFCKEPIAIDDNNDPYGIIASVIPSIVTESLIKFVVLSSNIIAKNSKLKDFLKGYPFIIQKRHWEIGKQSIFSNSHYMHYRCLLSMQKQSNYLYKCPVCRKVANCLIPVVSNYCQVDLCDSKSPIAKAILSFLMDIKLISINQGLNNIKYMRFPSIELRSSLKKTSRLHKFALSFIKLINRMCYIMDNTILGTLISSKDQGFKNLCNILRVLIRNESHITGLPYDTIVDMCIRDVSTKVANCNFKWLLMIFSKCLKSLDHVNILEEVKTCFFYMIDLQFTLNKVHLASPEDAYNRALLYTEKNEFKEIIKIHINRIYLLVKFFNLEQDCLYLLNGSPAIASYDIIKQTTLNQIKDPQFFKSWCEEVNRRNSTEELYYYLVFTMPFNLKCMLNENYIYYFELCYENKPPSTGSLSEKYICIACNKIISVNKYEEFQGKYPCLIKHCNKCWKSHGILINVRFGRLLVLTPFNGYEINLPYYNELGMCIASYLEDSTAVIDIDSIKQYTLNATESLDILQCSISGDDINNTKAIKGGGYIEVFNLLNE